MRSLGVAIAGAGGTRRKDDFYPTPPEAVVALLQSTWAPRKSALIWEPACGDGAIAKVLTATGYTVVPTDLVDRGFGWAPVDYFAETQKRASQVVTNPPFKDAERFIRHGFGLGCVYQAHLLKAQFWNAASRIKLFDEHPPAAVLPLTWRLDFTGGGAPTMDCCWVVWTGSAPGTQFEPLPRPLSPEGMLA